MLKNLNDNLLSRTCEDPFDDALARADSHKQFIDSLLDFDSVHAIDMYGSFDNSQKLQEEVDRLSNIEEMSIDEILTQLGLTI